MYPSIPHFCGGRAHLVEKKMVLGWNKYCCNRCGETFYRWITEKVLKSEKEFE
jgi:hypothetical protein